MGQSLDIPRVIKDDWKRLDLIINKIKFKLGRQSSPTFTGLTLTGLTASRLIATDASQVLESSDLYSWVTQTANQVLVADDGDGTITLSTPQDIHTGASPTFAGLTLTNAAVISSDSVVFQPNADSTTFFKVLDAGGSNTLFNVDTTNGRIGIGTDSPAFSVDLQTTLGSMQFQRNTDGPFGPAFYFHTESSTPANNDDTGVMLFSGNNDADQKTFVVSIETEMNIIADGNERGRIKFLVMDAGVRAVRMVIKGKDVGIGTTDPETFVEMESTAPYLTLHNSTHEDSDGGRESRINFKGEQSGGEETTLVRIEVGHDGAADDEKGYFDIFINDGNDSNSPTKKMRLDSNGLALTNLTASRLISSNGSKTLISVTDLTTWIAGTTDHISVADDSDGTVTLDLDTNTKTLLGSFNGIFLEKLDFTISVADSTVTGSLEKDGGGDLTQRFSDGYTTLDCTDPVLTIDLTAYVGTNAVPKEVFVYILQSAKTVMAASNSDWPATEHCKIARLILKSAATTGTDGGALGNQNINDFASAANGEGHITHVEHRLRQEAAHYDSGVALTLKNSAGAALNTGSSSTAVEIVTTEGKVYQLHRHTFPAFDMYTVAADDAHIANQVVDQGGAYETTADLVSDVTHYVDGTDAGVAIGNNKYFNLVIWGIQNRGGEVSHIMINLPTGQYTNESDATSDVDGTSVFSIPHDLKGTGFLIARLTFRLITGPEWIYIAQEDLRGQHPGLSAGVGVTTTDHALLANLAFASAGHTGFQAQGDVLDDLNTLGAAASDGQFIVATGSGAFAYEATTVVRTSLGLGTGDTVQFTAINLGHASDTTITRVSAGVVAIEGTNIAMVGGAHHDGFSDFVGNEHIDHTSVTLTAGTGLTGGGDISDNRSFAVDGVLEDLDTLGAVGANSEFLVGTGAGVLAWENATTAATSMGLGTGDSPTFTKLILSGVNPNILQVTGTDVANPTVTITSAGSIPLNLTSSSDTAYIKLQNSMDANGVMGYAQTSLYFWTENTVRAQINSTGIRSYYSVYIKEQAAALADTAAYGQVWVKNVSPNQLWFTDDSGTDNRLSGFTRPIILTPQSNSGPASNFATVDTIAGGSTPAEVITVLDFDPDASEYADFKIALPNNYMGGGLTVTIIFSMTSDHDEGTPHKVRWEVAFRRIQDDGEDINDVHAYSFNGVSAIVPSVVGEVSYDDITFTDGADMDSLAAEEMAILRIYRDHDHADDNATGDAELQMILIKET